MRVAGRVVDSELIDGDQFSSGSLITSLIKQCATGAVEFGSCATSHARSVVSNGRARSHRVWIDVGLDAATSVEAANGDCEEAAGTTMAAMARSGH